MTAPARSNPLADHPCRTSCHLQFIPISFGALLFLLTGIIHIVHGLPTSSINSSSFWHQLNTSVYKPGYGHQQSLFNFEHPKAFCSNTSDGIYEHPFSANTYYRCKSGDYELRHCPEGLSINKLTFECQYNKTGRPHLKTACTHQPDGVFPDYTTSCQHYYRCVQGDLKEILNCGMGMRFSISEQACTPYDQVACTQTHCSGTADGFFVTPGSMCKAYYSCFNGTKRDYICPSGFTFDRDNQVCSGSGGICYELICTGRVNGQYTDATHGCQRYYTCEGGEVSSVVGCPAHHLFDGSACVNRTSVSCDTVFDAAVGVSLPIKDNCAGRKDGVYSASDAQCKEYILCKSGNTIAQLQCPGGQRFDGHKCTSADLIPCYSYCTGRSDGYHANLRKLCHEYVQCVDEQVVEERICQQGTIFNGKMCVPTGLYACPNFNDDLDTNNRCSYLKDGYHTNYLSTCTDYFECFQGKMLSYNNCPEGNVFNGKQCVSSANFVCEGPEPSPICEARGNGLYADLSPPSQCKYYHYCYEGKQVRLSCPEDQVFNGHNCVLLESYKCPILESDCYNRTDGYYMDLVSGCHAYYYCSNGNKISYVCPHEHIFNGIECVLSNTYNCPTYSSNDCEGATNGYYADVNNNCEKYFYCLNSNKIMTLNCPPGEVFDGFKCVYSHDKTCQKTSKLSCLLLKDGHYIQPDSHCRKYFQCSNQKVITIDSCSEGYTFNGNTCEVMLNGSCHTIMLKQRENLSKCKKSSNGFFPNLLSGCKTYYYCIDGEKTSLSCPGAKLFNGEICVDSTNFHCPSSNIILHYLDNS